MTAADVIRWSVAAIAASAAAYIAATVVLAVIRATRNLRKGGAR